MSLQIINEYATQGPWLVTKPYRQIQYTQSKDKKNSEALTVNLLLGKVLEVEKHLS